MPVELAAGLRQRLPLARLLATGSTALFLVFAASLLPLLPPRLLDPLWQAQLSNLLVSQGPLAFLGLLLLRLAVFLAPLEQRWALRWIRVRRLAVMVVAGFVLLIPLQFALLGSGLHQDASRQQGRRAGIEERSQALRRLLSEAESVAELEAGLRRLGLPPLPAQARGIALPRLRQGLLEQLERERRRLASAPATRPLLLLLLDRLRVVIAAAALALGFAAAAQRRGAPVSLAEELQLAWRRRAAHRREETVSGRRDAPVDLAYFEQITPEEEADPSATAAPD